MWYVYKCVEKTDEKDDSDFQERVDIGLKIGRSFLCHDVWLFSVTPEKNDGNTSHIQY